MSLAERFTDVDPSALDERMKAGGMIPPGFYKASLIGAKNVTAKTGTPGFELTFKVSGGAFDGSDVTETLYDSENSRSQDRIALFGLRLGVLKRSPDGKKILPVEGKQDFMDVLDTPCIIETTIEEYTREKDGQKGHSVKLAFGGIYCPDDKDTLAKIGKPVEVKEAAKGGAKSGTGTGDKSTASKNGSGSSEPAKKKVDTSGL